MLLRSFRNLTAIKWPLLRSFSAIAQDKSELLIQPLSGSDEGILVIGLNRPKAKNSLSRSLTDALSETLDAVKHDRNVRLIVLRSLVPGVFCAGADLKERVKMTDTEVKIFVTRLRKLMSQLEDLPVPVIAALDGVALGGGLEMALACDIRVATDRSKMGLVETKLAIIPGAGGTQRLPRIVGVSLAKELIYTGRILSGEAAASVGLINHCIPYEDDGDAAYKKSLSIAREILPNGPLAIALAKKAIAQGSEVDISSGLSIEEMCYSQVVPTNDRLEGLKAFAEKRKPVYQGN